MKSMVIDAETFRSSPDICLMTEAGLLGVINTCLEQATCSCTVTALRYVEGNHRNWEVASLELQLTCDEDVDERLGYIGQLIGTLTRGYRVAWPSTLLH